MRELFVVAEASDDHSVVLSADPKDPDAERFYLDVRHAASIAELVGSGSSGEVAPTAMADSEDENPPAMQANAEEKPQAEPEFTESRGAETALAAAPATAVSKPPDREATAPDPGLSAPLTMRPREIQERVRAGASVSELAEGMGVAESRVEPFAHPVLLERARIAELARGTHPVRDDGPAKLTLAEVLATAFTARDIDPEAASWDSYRRPDGQWVATVTWHKGHTMNRAEWALQDHRTSSSTALPHNELATDLTDPEPARRSHGLHSVDGGQTAAEAWDAEASEPSELGSNGAASPAHPVSAEVEGAEDANNVGDPEDPPGPGEQPAKRRRRAVTPHWEDVLLGVRANTKRPRK